MVLVPIMLAVAYTCFWELVFVFTFHVLCHLYHCASSESQIKDNVPKNTAKSMETHAYSLPNECAEPEEITSMAYPFMHVHRTDREKETERPERRQPTPPSRSPLAGDFLVRGSAEDFRDASAAAAASGASTLQARPSPSPPSPSCRPSRHRPPLASPPC